MIRYLLGALAAALVWVLRELPAQFGGRAGGDRVTRSPQYRDGAFRNRARTLAAPTGRAKILRELVLGKQQRKPAGPVPLVEPQPPSGQGVHLTWYGHSSALVELDGGLILLDPVWGERVSPLPFGGPRRLHRPPVPVESLPQVDAVIISHDHYDHLDLATVRALVRTQTAPFVVPLGVGAHLRRWRVPADRIIELDWSESVTAGGVEIIATPAQHFSGRALKRDDTLWASYALIGPEHRVFYTGDTGYFPGFAEIGAQHGPFDATLVQIGAYVDTWPDIHMTPEEGVTAHQDLRGGLLVPVHWATFTLGVQDWAEPVDRLWAEAKAREVAVAIPRPGERVDVAAPAPVVPWWQLLEPGQTESTR
ncbi:MULTISPECIES: MBL fold metallo-hydrolase [unclassified Crossiella]|uniref:MBL fold metallo-hydrolase n=1 Tax=unclassified Crossiella TaxID=2620835 RepID=UPI001FFF3026|nr:MULTISPECIES: MBL fold metallo-hydrolase [unclassified Crossiella]MCK2239033.1 MBL fold metallo-hydrolase [Crossiella sp. S99.2]MCK2251398.1 MBL fold metallo-hydrolase [Crossiella sp. S99.1]